MPLIIETEKDIDKKLNVSDPYGNLSNELVAAYASIQTDKKNGEANGQNIKRIEGLAKNVLGYDEDEDPSETSIHLKSEQPKNALNISKRQVKKALHDIGKLPQDQRGKYGNLVTKIEHVFANALKGNRNANKITKQFQPNNIKPQKPQKTDDSSIKPLKAQNGTQIHIINENANGENLIEDYMEEYLHYNILLWFLNDKANNNGKNTIWFPLINPSEYQQALDYFEKFGELPKPLQNKPYQWFGIIVKNTIILSNCTDLCGHGAYFPEEDFLDIFFSSNEDGEWDEWLDENGLDDDYCAYDKYLNEIGFYDWCSLPDGSDAISDYGLQPLYNIIKEYNDNLSPEQVLVLVNKALDVYHARGDLSSMFIKGGSKVLSQISNSHLHENKKIMLKESQINVLKEYFNQLQIPFEEFGDENGKENYDYYIDYLEKIGQYGTLPPSNISREKISNCFEYEISNCDFSNYDSDYFDYLLKQYKTDCPSLYNIDESELQNIDDDYLFEYLTPEGHVELYNDLAENGYFYDTFNINEKGLIYVERVVSLDFDPKSEKSSERTYYNLKRDYDYIGTHWSYLKGGAEDFSHSSDFLRKQTSFIFKGYVSPKSIDFRSTVSNNLYYPEEHELTIENAEPIQINEIIWCKTNQKLPLHQPIIVKA